jgi:hypothetical protein
VSIFDEIQKFQKKQVQLFDGSNAPFLMSQIQVCSNQVTFLAMYVFFSDGKITLVIGGNLSVFYCMCYPKIRLLPNKIPIISFGGQIFIFANKSKFCLPSERV